MKHAAAFPASAGRRITILALSRVQSWRVTEQISTTAESIVVFLFAQSDQGELPERWSGFRRVSPLGLCPPRPCSDPGAALGLAIRAAPCSCRPAGRRQISRSAALWRFAPALLTTAFVQFPLMTRCHLRPLRNCTQAISRLRDSYLNAWKRRSPSLRVRASPYGPFHVKPPTAARPIKPVCHWGRVCALSTAICKR